MEIVKDTSPERTGFFSTKSYDFWKSPWNLASAAVEGSLLFLVSLCEIFGRDLPIESPDKLRFQIWNWRNCVSKCSNPIQSHEIPCRIFQTKSSNLHTWSFWHLGIRLRKKFQLFEVCCLQLTSSKHWFLGASTARCRVFTNTKKDTTNLRSFPPSPVFLCDGRYIGDANPWFFSSSRAIHPQKHKNFQ